MLKSQLEQYETMLQLLPPSAACCYEVHKNAHRTGWWAVEEAKKAIEAGLSPRMMLEVSPDLSYGVLSPAYRSCEGNVSLSSCRKNGCTFCADGLCRLYNTGLQPLECRFGHHPSADIASNCHQTIERDWRTSKGQALVQAWTNEVGLWVRYKFTRNEQPAANLHTR